MSARKAGIPQWAIRGSALVGAEHARRAALPTLILEPKGASAYDRAHQRRAIRLERETDESWHGFPTSWESLAYAPHATPARAA